MKDGDSWRKWIDLCKDERRLIISSIAQLLLSKGFGHKITERIIGEVYVLENEEEGTEIHDAKEFATLLNSTEPLFGFAPIFNSAPIFKNNRRGNGLNLGAE